MLKTFMCQTDQLVPPSRIIFLSLFGSLGEGGSQILDLIKLNYTQNTYHVPK